MPAFNLTQIPLIDASIETLISPWSVTPDTDQLFRSLSNTLEFKALEESFTRQEVGGFLAIIFVRFPEGLKALCLPSDNQGGQSSLTIDDWMAFSTLDATRYDHQAQEAILFSPNQSKVSLKELLDPYLGHLPDRSQGLGKDGFFLTKAHLQSALIEAYHHPLIQLISKFNQKSTGIFLGALQCWLGKSPKSDIRFSGSLYPPEKILSPLLDFLVPCLEKMTSALAPCSEPEILYEDEFLVAIDKPSGLLSVPGKAALEDALTLTAKSLNQTLYTVHRLDMPTSGLLLFAKDKCTQALLGNAFRDKTAQKIYRARLLGELSEKTGEVNLPLMLNPYDRPRQLVHPFGKSALTHYEVIGEKNDETDVFFYPQTGRTHQLRVHAAHALGLNAPIKGDVFYAPGALALDNNRSRLYLHAEKLTIEHPQTKKALTLRAKAPF